MLTGIKRVQKDVNSITVLSGKELQIMKRPDSRLCLSVYFTTGVEHVVLIERNALELVDKINKMYPNSELPNIKSIEFDFTALDGQIIKFTKFVSGQMSIRISDIDDDVKPIILSLSVMDAVFFRNVLNAEYPPNSDPIKPRHLPSFLLRG